MFVRRLRPVANRPVIRPFVVLPVRQLATARPPRRPSGHGPAVPIASGSKPTLASTPLPNVSPASTASVASAASVTAPLPASIPASLDSATATPLLEKLLSVPRAQRDSKWHVMLYQIMPTAEVAVVPGDNNIYRGPDGFPYLSVATPSQYPLLVSAAAAAGAKTPAEPPKFRTLLSLVDVMAREGCGCVFDVHNNDRYAVLTYGSVWSAKEYGGNFNAPYPGLWGNSTPSPSPSPSSTGSTGTASPNSETGMESTATLKSGSAVIHKLDAKNMRLSTASDLILPAYTRRHIHAWMKNVGCAFQDILIAQPLSEPTSSDSNITLLFSVCREDFQGRSSIGSEDAKIDAAWAKEKKKLRFFLPLQFPYLTSSRDIFAKHRARIATGQAAAIMAKPSKR